MIVPSIDYLRECFDCDSDSGLLIWKARPRRHFKDERSYATTNSRFAGQAAGAVTRWGYVYVQLGSERIHAHRIIWAINTGAWPSRFLDHINGDKADNRIANLREADRSQNGANRPVSPKNKVGLKGVCPHGRRFRAQIKTREKVIYLGMFDTPELAHEAYAAAAIKHHGEYAGGIQKKHAS